MFIYREENVKDLTIRSQGKVTALYLETDNDPNSIIKITSTIKKFGMDIRNMIVYTENDKSYVLMYISGSFHSEDKILSNLKGNTNIYEVKAIELKSENTLHALQKLSLFTDPYRAVVMASPILEGIIECTQNQPSLKAMLWYQGYNVGIKLAFLCKEIYGAPSIYSMLELFKNMNLIYGLSKIEYVKNDVIDYEFILRLHNNWECNTILRSKGVQKEPQSVFTRGMLEGFFKEVFNGIDFIAVETKCIALGDPYCEFIVKPRGYVQYN